jgi:hypothetical protein
MKKMMVIGLICAVAVMILAAGCCSQCCKCKTGNKCDTKAPEVKKDASVPAAPAGK